MAIKLTRAFLVKDDKITKGWAFEVKELRDGILTKKNERFFTEKRGSTEFMFTDDSFHKIFFAEDEAMVYLQKERDRMRKFYEKEIKEYQERLKELNDG